MLIGFAFPLFRKPMSNTTPTPSESLTSVSKSVIDVVDVNLHDLILANGWEQGSLAALSALGIEEDLDIVFIAVTQTCDLANSSLEKEPEVEFVQAQIVTEKNPNFENLKNSRCLQVYSHEKIYEINLRKRYFFAREILKNIRPIGRLDEKSLRSLQDFMARRYRRPAYADEFNKRWQNQNNERKIRKNLEKLNLFLSMLLISGDDVTVEKITWEQEKTEENTYSIDFKGILKVDKNQDERNADDILQKIVSIFNDCDGIKAKGVIFLESELTYTEYRQSLIWDADSISSAAGDDTILSSP